MYIIYIYILRAYARTGIASTAVFNAFEKQIPLIVHNFTARELANTIWSFSKLNFHSATIVYDCVAKRVPVTVKEFKSQELCMILWAYANSSRYDSEIFKWIMAPICSMMNRLNHRDLCMVAWAYRFSSGSGGSSSSGGGGSSSSSSSSSTSVPLIYQSIEREVLSQGVASFNNTGLTTTSIDNKMKSKY